MKSAVVLFPGTNRERDMVRALAAASGSEPVIVWHGDTELPKGLDLIVLPGGFSHGDYLRCGAMAARSPIMTEVKAAAARGVRVMGICNGFQILTEAGLLPGALMRNRDLRFICKDVHLRVETADSDFTRAYRQGQVVKIIVAHGDGNYFADDETIARLEGDGRVAFRYSGSDGTVDEAHNPNGSRANIAGILSDNRRVLGMMPHPEDHVEDLHGCLDGRPLFSSLAETFASGVLA